MAGSWETRDERLVQAARASLEQYYQTQPLTQGNDERGGRSANVSSANVHTVNTFHSLIVGEF